MAHEKQNDHLCALLIQNTKEEAKSMQNVEERKQMKNVKNNTENYHRHQHETNEYGWIKYRLWTCLYDRY